MVDEHTPKQRAYNMSRVKGSDSLQKRTLRSLFHSNGFKFRLQDWQLSGCPDIVLSKYRSVIFVHACFWHRHKGCQFATTPKTRLNFWIKKFNQNVERDQKNILLLKAKGRHPIVVWECELKQNTDSVLRSVSAAIKHQLLALDRA